MCNANSYSCWPWGDSAECKNVEEPKQGEGQEAYDARVSVLGWRIGHWDGQAYYVCPDHHCAVWDALPISMDEDVLAALKSTAAKGGEA
ncbi:MAG: hypothetical protein LCH57_01725 [Proteobacteria bacterium]|nr:hypothetical protein [Pseudomonadota bacterium]